MKARNFLSIFCLFFITTSIQAKEYANLEHLLEQSTDYLRQQLYAKLPQAHHLAVNIQSFSLAPRLKLVPCDKPLTFEHKREIQAKGNISLKVSCASPHPWAIYTKHRISLLKEVAISINSLPKEHIITTEDISYVKRDIHKHRAGYITNKQDILGLQLTRPIAAGNMIYRHHLKRPHLIKKGDKVNVVAKVGSLSVITPGKALNNGHKGEQIDVENQRSSRIIRAEVTGPDTVHVIL